MSQTQTKTSPDEATVRDEDPRLRQQYLNPTILQSFGPHPVNMICPYCHLGITTRITRDKSTLQWILAGAIVVLCCPVSCCLAPIPFFINSLMMVTHSCPACYITLGRYDGCGC